MKAEMRMRKGECLESEACWMTRCLRNEKLHLPALGEEQS